MIKPTYSTSTGERLTTSQIETRMKVAKMLLLEKQQIELGYNVCSTCFRNDCKPVTCAHIISIKEAKETGRAELCYDVENMIPEGLKCHQKRDGLNIQYANKN